MRPTNIWIRLPFEKLPPRTISSAKFSGSKISLSGLTFVYQNTSVLSCSMTPLAFHMWRIDFSHVHPSPWIELHKIHQKRRQYLSTGSIPCGTVSWRHYQWSVREVFIQLNAIYWGYLPKRLSLSETGIPAYTRTCLAQSLDSEFKIQHRLSRQSVLRLSRQSDPRDAPSTPSDMATRSLPPYFAHIVKVKLAHPHLYWYY